MRKTRKSPLISAFVLLILNIFSLTFSLTSFAEETSEQAESELIASYDFEADAFQCWSSLGNKSTLFIDKTKSHEGKSCISTVKRMASWSGPSLNITDMVVVGTEVVIQAYVICGEGAETDIVMSMKTIEENGTENYCEIGKEHADDNGWVFIEGRYEIPENASEFIVYFQTAEGLCDFSIDDVSIIGTRAGQDDEGDLSEYNFGFESGLENWISRGESLVVRTSDYCYGGSSSLYVSGRRSFWNSAMVRLKNIPENVNYNYSAYVMYNGSEYEDNYIFSIKLQYTLGGKEVYSEIASKEVQKDTWSKISGDFIIPRGATDVFFYVQTDDSHIMKNGVTENDLMSFYIDNVSIFDNTYMARKLFVARVVKIVCSIVGLLVLAVVSFLIFRKIRHTQAVLLSASIDAMTQAFNRNTYEKYLEEIEASPEKCKKIYVTVCDVNFLKYINDNYGHEAGDRAIIRCAEVLLRVVGKKGKVYRTGGDEFMCITRVDLTDSIKSEFSLEASHYKGYPFSVAVGTAHYDSDLDFAPDIKTILKRSDMEMYKHKQEIKKFTQDLTNKEFIIGQKGKK